MGARLCCEEEETELDTVKVMQLMSGPSGMDLMELPSDVPADKAVLFDGKLTGKWRKQIDNSNVGIIKMAEIEWDPSFFQNQTSALRQVDATTMIMKLESQEHTAKVSLSGQMSITWSDGEVWLRR
ncbi:unnamed protein product [Polarella glacialis]|uniref:Uncharacterized protein n=1 Tax=Polarella glacialis TaxID=89957 RepID=A0A813DIL2_POLGL|nr:unnamed protein product [Polarella glacialis]